MGLKKVRAPLKPSPKPFFSAKQRLFPASISVHALQLDKKENERKKALEVRLREEKELKELGMTKRVKFLEDRKVRTKGERMLASSKRREKLQGMGNLLRLEPSSLLYDKPEDKWFTDSPVHHPCYLKPKGYFDHDINID